MTKTEKRSENKVPFLRLYFSNAVIVDGNGIGTLNYNIFEYDALQKCKDKVKNHIKKYGISKVFFNDAELDTKILNNYKMLLFNIEKLNCRLVRLNTHFNCDGDMSRFKMISDRPFRDVLKMIPYRSCEAISSPPSTLIDLCDDYNDCEYLDEPPIANTTDKYDNPYSRLCNTPDYSRKFYIDYIRSRRYICKK